MGAILQEHEALPGGLQIRQGQHPGGGSRQRCRGLLHRSVPDGALLSSSPSFIYPDGSFRLEYVKAGSLGGRGGLGGEVLSSGAGGGGIAGCRTRPHGGCLRFGECSRLLLGCPSCPHTRPFRGALRNSNPRAQKHRAEASVKACRFFKSLEAVLFVWPQVSSSHRTEQQLPPALCTKEVASWGRLGLQGPGFGADHTCFYSHLARLSRPRAARCRSRIWPCAGGCCAQGPHPARPQLVPRAAPAPEGLC